MASLADLREVLEDVEEVREHSVLVREVQFRLGKLGTAITARIFLDTFRDDSDPFRFELSHYIHTPSQAGPYHPSSPYAESEEEALRAAINRTLASYYRSAVREGHEPQEEWLVARDW